MHCGTRTGGILAALAVLATAPATAQQFGGSVAVSGREAFVGQPGNQYAPGMVYVFTANCQGGWQRGQRIVAADTANNDGFGASIAVDGQNLLVGATRAMGGQGQVYVFQKRGNEWRRSGAFGAGEGSEGLGNAIAVNGNVAAVGASATSENAGAVHLFTRSGSGWTHDTTLTPQGAGETARFGTSLALQGDLLVVGAANADSGLGGAFVFRNANGSWRQDARLTVPQLTRPAQAGMALAIKDGFVLVGMPAAYGAGAVAIFTHDSAANRWRPATRLLPYEAPFNARFGSAIATVGNEVWVGAPGTNGFEGVVYRFTHDANHRITSVARVAPDSLGAPAFFGNTIAIGADGAVVGMPFFESQSGAAALLSRTGTEWRVRERVVGDDVGLAAITGDTKQCRDGKVGMFECGGSDLLSFLPVKDIGGAHGTNMNDIWGWTDPETQREYVIAGRTDGTAFVDVTDPSNPVYLGNLPKTEGSPSAAWRDIKVYRNHAFIVADASREHGMQVFDLTRLRNVRPGTPQTFTTDAHYRQINSAHNIVINEESGFAYAVGASSGGETCGGGLHMINIQDPKNPTFAGCFADPATGRAGTGYSHDAQCVMYRGPDARFRGREICLGSNETALSIADVTDKSNPVAISHASYPDVGYTHQGWFDEEQRYFYMDDELDELSGKTDGTRTIIWDLAKLDEPVVAAQFVSHVKASDHNLYVKGDFVYQSNYQAGLRILDIRDRENPREVGFFDTVPVGENTPGFGGSWSNYPYFPSGTIAVTSGSEGLFLVKKRDMQPVP